MLVVVDSGAGRELLILESVAHLLEGFLYRCRNDDDFTCLYLTTGFGRITGYPTEAFLGPNARRFGSLTHHDDIGALERSVRQAIERREPWSSEYRIVTADGIELWVHENGNGIYQDGDLVYLEGAIVSIDRQKQHEAQLRSLAARAITTAATLSSVVERVLQNLGALNLVSVNARIEASRMPEGAAGFNVVAEEIKRLAESTRADASEMRKLVNTLALFAERDDLLGEVV